jgi:putative transposase
MAIPHRGRTSESTYFVTTNCWDKKSLLQTDRSASLLVAIMLSYREAGKYQLHEFAVMPNHLHLLLTPTGIALERAMQLIKGRFSFDARAQFGIPGEIWQTSFVDRRVRDAQEYARYRDYIHQNPVRRGLVSSAEEWTYSSASGAYSLDDVPQRLKPSDLQALGMQA